MTWQYIAGFFDGEGSLCLANRGSNCWRARLHQSKTDVLYRMRDFLLLEGINSYVMVVSKQEKIGNTKYIRNGTVSALNIRTHRENLIKFLRLILPYLVVKKVLVQDVLRFLKLYPKLHNSKHYLKSKYELSSVSGLEARHS